MLLWRLSREIHASLDGEGARKYGGCWNSPGWPAVYCAGSAALAVLEVRVHLDLPLDLLPNDYCLFGIETGGAVVEESPIQALETSQVFGDGWLAANSCALLKVPSVIVPEEWNFLINPLHPDAKRIQIVSKRSFTFDPRLF